MELLFGILIILAVVFVVNSNARRSARKVERLLRPSRPLSKRPSQQKRNAKRAPNRPVFDASTAKPIEAGTVLEGYSRIIDGDSLIVEGQQVRLYGVDAPELDHPFGQKAKWALVALCKGQTVRAEVTEQDAYGRTVALCFLEDGRDISAEMVSQGLAIDWAKFSDGVYRKLEPEGVRKRLWLADARQKGRMDVWERFEAKSKRS